MICSLKTPGGKKGVWSSRLSQEWMKSFSFQVIRVLRKSLFTVNSFFFFCHFIFLTEG